MEALMKLSQNLSKLNLEAIERKLLEENKAEIMDLNIDQLKYGQDADGGLFPEYSNNEYFKAKQSEGLTESAGRHYNLLLTSDFRSGFFTKIEDTNLVIDSKDSKRDKLVDLVSGQNIFGLQEKNMKEVEKIFLPEIENEILEVLNEGI